MRRNRRSIWGNTAAAMLISALFGVICCLGGAMIFSLLIYKFIGNMQLSEWFNAISLTAGAYSAAYFNGKHRRRRGLIEGAVCGAVIYAVLSGASLVLTGGITDIKKLLLLAAAGGAGGVCGVNSKRPKKLME